MAKKLDTTYKSARFGNCTYALILDKRHLKKDKNTFPVVMRYTIDRKSWYNFVAGEFTEEDFQKHAMREAMNRVYSRMQEHPDDYSRFSVEMMKVGAQRLQLP